MFRSRLLLAVASAAVIVTAFSSEVSARHRHHHWAVRAADYCGGRLPAYGFDGCGFPEFSYGPDSCWRRVIVRTHEGLRPRRVFVCGPGGRAGVS
jgi:hypothetical protein